MARNKRPQAADEKRQEIVAAARRLFIDDGYDATPMNRLAKEAGVAANTIYWYFGDKDDVLIAVLAAVMVDVWPQYQHDAGGSIAARLLWVLRHLQQMDRLVMTVHARVDHSPAVARWHDDFHAATSAALRAELVDVGVPAAAVEAEVMIGVFTIEGLLMHTRDEDQQRTVLEVLAARWTPTG